MSARDKSILFLFTRGGDILRHKLHMLLQNIVWVLMVGTIICALVFVLAATLIMNPTQRDVLQYYLPARVETAILLGGNYYLSREVSVADADGVGETNLGTERPAQIVREFEQTYRLTVAPKAWIAFRFGLVAFAVTFFGLAGFYLWFGRHTGEDEHIKGAKVCTADELAAAVRKAERGAGPYKFAGVPVPTGAELGSFLVTGAPSSGKSVLILDLMDQAAAAGKKMIVYDKAAEFTEVFYRPGQDVLLNILDIRFPGWNIYREVDADYDFDQIAHSLIPDPERGNASSNYFFSGARAVFSCAMQRLYREGRRRTSDLADVLLNFGIDEMAEFLQGTPASAYVSPRAAEQAAGVLSTLVGAIQVFKYIPDGDFCIREWVQRDDDSRLFITTHETIHAVVKPLIHMFADLALRAAMTRKKGRNATLWIYLDECASLGAMPILKDSLTQARKYGVAHVLGLQNISQLVAEFGPDVAKTLSSTLQNYVVLRVSDADTQKTYSELLGNRELDQLTEGVSWGANSSRDGANLQTQNKEKWVVMRGELGRLPDCEGFLKLLGDFDVARVKFKPKDRKQIAEGFIRREDLLLANQPAPAPIVITGEEIPAPEAAQISLEDLPMGKIKFIAWTIAILAAAYFTLVVSSDVHDRMDQRRAGGTGNSAVVQLPPLPPPGPATDQQPAPAPTRPRIVVR